MILALMILYAADYNTYLLSLPTKVLFIDTVLLP